MLNKGHLIPAARVETLQTTGIHHVKLGTQFTSKVWPALCQQLQFEARMTTAYNPETDGQTERINPVMEQYL